MKRWFVLNSEGEIYDGPYRTKAAAAKVMPKGPYCVAEMKSEPVQPSAQVKRCTSQRGEVFEFL